MSHLLVEQRDGVAIITLNRPEKRNALSPEMVVRLADFWREVATDDSVRVVVVSRKMQGHDQELFRQVGVEPAEQAIIAVKSSVHFRAHFQPIASEVIVVTAPGPVVADPAILPFTNLRPGLRLRPGDNRAWG